MSSFFKVAWAGCKGLLAKVRYAHSAHIAKTKSETFLNVCNGIKLLSEAKSASDLAIPSPEVLIEKLFVESNEPSKALPTPRKQRRRLASVHPPNDAENVQMRLL